MPRNKYPEITEKRILDTATKLFLEKGWEETTIQDIVDDLGDLTRGAFYHHFKSKEDIIDAVLNQLATENDPFKEAKKISGLNGLEKLRMAFLLSFENIGQVEAVKTISHILNNPKLIAKQLQECVHSGAPDILAFIEEGVIDGSISVQYPKQTSETYMLLTNIWLSPIIFSVDTEEYLLKAKHLQELFNSIGLPVIDDQILATLEKFHKAISI
ncbi:TetR/AcrR family transcriptional regulator [Bacillus salipaludis]|uniref:TetR/AcrR family transcriptional regulator n=1 Tax=Bacillus salipaludis TaxID=2547811 RepID=A0A4R5VHK2_9BACI|nr:TetR/AcrR family transcriptional regulator [Bacillus salipaludis]MDQ6597952.1 TetR/AcrR family transcriptional regulator [Bacillus salipaludis]TDK53382.1 TetR/AcrR family transcriptional regulator [Bacillus salipaludis]